MRKSILILATAFTFSAFFTSCRETTEEKNEIEVNDDMDDLDDVDDMDDMDDVENDIERAADDAGNAVEEAAQDVEDEIEGNDDLQ